MSDLEKDRETRMKTSVRRGEKPDRSIPFCNVILRCDHYGAPAARLPEDTTPAGERHERLFCPSIPCAPNARKTAI